MNNLFVRMLIAGPSWFWGALKIAVNTISPFGSKKRLTVLIYHHVLPENVNMLDEGAIGVAAFNWQMRLVSKVFNVLTLDQALELLKKDSLPRRSVAITFDDGYLDNYTEALPILNRYGLMATFFVVGNAVKEGNIWNQRLTEAILKFDCEKVDLTEIGLGIISLANEEEKVNANLVLNEQLKNLAPKEQNRKVAYITRLSRERNFRRAMLNEAQIAKMVDGGMEIGCHTMNHPMLSVVPIDAAEQDILESKYYLNEVSGQNIKYFAYPYGKLGQHFTVQHAKLVEKLDFKAAFTSDWGTLCKETNPFLINRFTPWDKTPIRFLLRLALNFNRKD
ncbi:MAG: polysaccharide deacetylase family protein [Pseudomonadales bacterium]|nr:polysaccharide deacetylase family protein [Pseudomonadales bacterium]